MDESSVNNEDQVSIGGTLDQDLENLFSGICYAVRARVDAQTGDSMAKSYATRLLQEIQSRRTAGELIDSEYDYCLAAANEILALEMIYFGNQFETMAGAD